MVYPDIQQLNSPIFPQQVLSPVDQSLQLPDKPLASTASVQVYIVLAEPNLFVQGFDVNEYQERPPSLLRGVMYLRILKPVKIKSISLTFKGVARTDWPEGIPPKRQQHSETEDLINHTWPFYSGQSTLNNGADMCKPLPENLVTNEDVSLFSLDTSTSFIARSLSPSGVLRRNHSPSLSSVASPSLAVHNSFSDLSSVISLEDNKPGSFTAGDYLYNFEHPIPASTAESTQVTFGSVKYFLEASIIRGGTFKSNINAKYPINIVRTPSDTSIEDSEPIAISKDWEDQLHYDIVIASKSIILDSYIPIAFKLTPLSKVQLHRIRIYLTENLEYYCRNKKVHRMEPAKKYMLLEHKAPHGESILGEESKELEFQLYVPEKLNERSRLHPDTSFTNIQCHHWIKLCLRLSKTDPNDETKRKHYEISIDSPIHLLSSLAVHANTLLPAYHQDVPHFLTESQNSLSSLTYNQIMNSPPLSPGVIPVENSIDGMFNFSHLDSMVNPNEIDNHLEANVYKPGSDHPELKSPQAVPFSPLNSPSLSPARGLGFGSARPMHLIRRPSINPPPFDADSTPPMFGDEPPAYTSIEGALQEETEEDLGEDNIDEILRSSTDGSSKHSNGSFLDNSTQGSSYPDEQAVANDDGYQIPEIRVEERGRRESENAAKSPDLAPEADMGSSFKFRGSSPFMPDSVMRHSSPSPTPKRETNSKKVDFEPGSIDSIMGEGSSHVNGAGVSSPIDMNSPNDRTPGLEPVNSLDTLNIASAGYSRNSSRSSIHSLRSLMSSTSFEPMEPLLHSVSTAGSNKFNQDFRDRNESVDITSILNGVNSGEPLWHAVDSDFYDNHPPRMMGDNRRFSSFSRGIPKIPSAASAAALPGSHSNGPSTTNLPILSVIDSEDPLNSNSSSSTEDASVETPKSTKTHGHVELNREYTIPS